VERRGLSIGDVRKAQFDDYVSVDGSVVPIQVVQIAPEEGGVVLEKVVEEGAHVRRGDVIVRLGNSNLDLEILNAESELAEKQNMLRNTQITMEQDRLSNQNEAAQLAMEVQARKRAYGQHTALQQEQLNSRDEYLKAKEGL
jgi:HlyD family secretion protein